MPERHILVVAVDGLRASALGAYGNTTYPTPALDELAAESFLFDSCFAPSAELAAIYRALWQSVHPLRTDLYTANAATLMSMLTARGYTSTLVTDVAEVASLPGAGDFAECVQIPGGAESRARDVAQTTLARLFADAGEIVSASRSAPQLVWLHARGLYGPWDAPLELQEMLRDEGDPPPVESVAPPELKIGESDDPDTAFRYSVAYAAQAMVLDACWQAIGDAVAASGTHNWLVVLLGVRGFPLGEHDCIGGIERRLYADALQVPCMVRFPDGMGRMARSGRLISPLDLAPTLIEWIGSDVAMDMPRFDGRSLLPIVQTAAGSWREAIVSSGDAGRRAIRTSGWSLCYDVDAEDGQLFVRPDDRWEANDVAALCPDEVERLKKISETMVTRIRGGEAMFEEPRVDESQR